MALLKEIADMKEAYTNDDDYQESSMNKTLGIILLRIR